MDTHNFDAQAVLANLRHKRRLMHPVRYRPSKLDPYRAELMALRSAGASFPQLVAWLSECKRIHADHTTVMRYLHRHSDDV